MTADPEAERRLQELLESWKRAYRRLRESEDANADMLAADIDKLESRRDEITSSASGERE